MRAVIDTNIFLAAALAIAAGKRTGSREVFEELLPVGQFEHFTSTPILYEIGDVLSRPELGIPSAMIEPFMAQIEMLSIIVPIRNLSMGMTDRKDDKFLETAVQGRADVIVTRDSDFQHPGAQRTLRTYNCQVMSLRAFLAALDHHSYSFRKLRHDVRAGWAEASKDIAATGDDALVWPEFASEGDAEFER